MAITKGLFGYDPYEIQMQQQQRLMQPITQATNPYERIGAGLGTLLGASLFDIQDPRLARAAKLGNIMKQVMGENADPTAADFAPKLEKLAETLLAEGEVDAAAYAMEQAKKFAPKREIRTVGNQVVDFSGATPQVLFTGTEKEGKLANRLVELDTKLATEGLTAKEAAEKNALERVVRLQSPKGTNVDLTGFADLLGEKAAQEEGKKLGQDIAAMEGKRQAVESLTNARQILSQGVYTGSYANFQTELAKKSLGAVGDLGRVENTEVFLNEVSSNVIPLLQEFGGNDSNEELKFLQRLVGGDVTLQQKSIERILDNAIRKINRGIERTATRGQAVREGKTPEMPKPTTKTTTRTTKSGVQYQVIED